MLVGTLTAAVTDKALSWIGQRPSGPGLFLVLLVPWLLVCQAAVMPTSAALRDDITNVPKNKELSLLVTETRNTKRPVLSYDMVLLLKAGKEVPWEPAIFAELACAGRWDERRITNMIAARDFAFVVTMGRPGTPYDTSCGQTVSRAIEAAYPYTEEYAERTVHRSSDRPKP